MAYNKGRKPFKKKFKKERKMRGLVVDVYNNNIEKALRLFKKKVKESGIMLDVKKNSYFEKPSRVRREKKNLQKSRYRYLQEKEKNSSF